MLASERFETDGRWNKLAVKSDVEEMVEGCER